MGIAPFWLLNGTSLNSVNALLALNRRICKCFFTCKSLYFALKGHSWCRSTAAQRLIKFSNLFACPLNLLTPHLVTQWGDECSGVNAVPLVSVLQTRSSRMFVFKMKRNLDTVKYLLWYKDWLHHRPYALTSRHVSITTTPCWGSRLVALHARVVLEERWRSQPLSQCAGPGKRPGGKLACRGWLSLIAAMLGDGAHDSASLKWGPKNMRTGWHFCDVICINE